MKPFDEYPTAGRKLMGPLDCRDNLRHGYWLDLQQRTGQTHCAYCGADLMSENHNKRNIRVDRIISSAEAMEIGVPAEFACDAINAVLCCSVCYGHRSEYSAIDEPQIMLHISGLSDFILLRNRVFTNRKRLIAERKAREEAASVNSSLLPAA